MLSLSENNQADVVEAFNSPQHIKMTYLILIILVLKEC